MIVSRRPEKHGNIRTYCIFSKVLFHSLTQHVLQLMSSLPMPQPSIPRQMATRACNADIHPGIPDISIEEEGEGRLPKTPVQRKKRAKQNKQKKSAEEVEVGIQCVAAYERQSLNEELINATPQAISTPAAHCDHSESHNLSEHNVGGNMNDNMSYKLPSNSTVDTLMATDADIGSLPSPLAKVSPGRNTIGGKKATVRLTREGTLTESESEDEPTLLKKVVGERWKESVKDAGTDSTEEPTQLDRKSVV